MESLDLHWNVYRSITDLESDLWKLTIGFNEATIGDAIFKAIEKVSSRDNFYYLLCLKNNRPVGIVFLNITTIDIAAEFEGALRKIIKGIRAVLPNFLMITSGMTGTFATTGKHWWYDPEEIGESVFLHSLLEMVKQTDLDVPLLLFRDIFGHQQLSSFRKTSESLEIAGFHSVKYHPAAVLHLNPVTIDQYISGLDRKTRATLRKAHTVAVEHSLSFDIVENYAELIDEIYPLYRATNDRANELRVPPLSKDLFHAINSSDDLESLCFVIRDGRKHIVSFTMAWRINTTLNAFCLGFDYTINRKLLLIYQNYLFLVKWSLTNGVRQIEMGLTNYFVKKRLGCTFEPITLFLRFRNPIINRIMSKGVKLFDVH